MPPLLVLLVSWLRRNWLTARIASRTTSITVSSITGAIAGGIAVDTIAGPIARAIAGVYERSDLESALKS